MIKEKDIVSSNQIRDQVDQGIEELNEPSGCCETTRFPEFKALKKKKDGEDKNF